MLSTAKPRASDSQDGATGRAFPTDKPEARVYSAGGPRDRRRFSVASRSPVAAPKQPIRITHRPTQSRGRSILQIRQRPDTQPLAGSAPTHTHGLALRSCGRVVLCGTVPTSMQACNTYSSRVPRAPSSVHTTAASSAHDRPSGQRGGPPLRHAAGQMQRGSRWVAAVGPPESAGCAVRDEGAPGQGAPGGLEGWQREGECSNIAPVARRIRGVAAPCELAARVGCS